MKREKWIEESKAKLARWDSRISEMEARASALGEQAKAEYHALAGKAREWLGRAEAQIADAQADGAETWDRVQKKWEENKRGVEAVLEEMREGADEAGSQRQSARAEVPRR